MKGTKFKKIIAAETRPCTLVVIDIDTVKEIRVNMPKLSFKIYVKTRKIVLHYDGHSWKQVAT